MYQTARDAAQVDRWTALGYSVTVWGQDSMGLFCRLFRSLR